MLRVCGGRESRRRARAVLLAGLISAALAVAGLLPAAASAATRGFQVYNLSSHPIKFKDIELIQGGATFDSTPAAGAVLQPGAGFHDFEQTYYFAARTSGTAIYQILGDSGQPIGQFNAQMDIGLGVDTYVYCATSVGTCTTNRFNTLTLLDPPGTVINVPAAQGQAQAAVLNQLCQQDNSAACNFTVTNEASIDSPSHQVGNALINNTDEEQETDVKISDTVGSTDSVEISLKAGAKILDVVEVSITAKYSHEWTREHTFEQRVTVNCKAHTKCWIMGTAPMLRDTGDFRLTLGNTTWNLPGVYFDSPDPNGNGAYEVDSQPLSASERAGLPRGVIQVGTDGNDNLVGTKAKDVIFARAGHDTVRALGGSDRVDAGAGKDVVSGGRGNDIALGGPGRDRLIGGAGRDRLIGGPGRDNVRR
jgi:Ca2+-binding RTX toxin-like protein